MNNWLVAHVSAMPRNTPATLSRPRATVIPTLSFRLLHMFYHLVIRFCRLDSLNLLHFIVFMLDILLWALDTDRVRVIDDNQRRVRTVV